MSAPPDSHAGGGERTAASYVAVSGDPAAAQHSASAVPRGERRGLQRLLRDEALTATTRSRELFASIAVVAAAVLATVDLPDVAAGPVVGRMTAMACSGALCAGMFLLRRAASRDTRWRLTVVVQLVVAQALILVSVPWWLGTSLSTAALLSITVTLAAVAVAAASLLAPLGLVALAVSALPLGAGFGWVVSAAAAEQWPIVSGAFASGLAALVAVTLRRNWVRQTLTAIAQRRLVRELEAARDAAIKADQEKSRFLAIASHDLRQPVHAIGLFAATLEQRLEGSAEQPLIRNLNRAIDGLDRSFNVMLDISRLDAGAVEPRIQNFPLRDLFRRLHMHYAGQAEQKGLGLRFSPGGKSVNSDPQLLERVLGNLLQNAIRYTATGGIVVVARSTETHLNVEVWDSGVGIAAPDLHKVFDEFYQVGGGPRVRSQGLGMGLAIVKRLVRLLGHELIVASRPGRGTMFRLRIAHGGLGDFERVTAAADTLPMPALQPRTVLVLDDEEAIRDGLCMLLREWGYDALAAGTIAQARQAVRELDAPPDLILSDLHLGDGPDGIAGIDLIRRECGCDVAAMLITGDTTHAEIRRATESGHPVLFKPVQPRKLYDALRALGA